MRTAFQQTHGCFSDSGWRQVKLPIRFQGCGISDFKAIGPLAYFASIADTASFRADLPHNGDSQAIIQGEIPHLLAHLSNYGIANGQEEIPPDIASTFHPTSHGLQRRQATLSRAVAEAQARSFWSTNPASRRSTEEEVTPFDDLKRHAHRISIGAKGGFEFLTALPTPESLSLPHFWAIQVRLYCREPVIAPSLPSGHCGLVMDVFGHHAIAGCASGQSRFHRHDAIVSAFARYVLQPARLTARREIPGLVPGTDNRPADLFVIIPQSPATQGFHPKYPEIDEHALDISIRNISGSSQKVKLRAAVRARHGCAEIAEREKEAEFRRKMRMAPRWAERLSKFAFSPIGFDATGAWGPRALQVLRFCSKMAAQFSVEPQLRLRNVPCSRYPKGLCSVTQPWYAPESRPRYQTVRVLPSPSDTHL